MSAEWNRPEAPARPPCPTGGAKEESPWSRNTAIYYRSEKNIMRIPVETQNGFRVGRPEVLFEDIYYGPAATPASHWALHPDGDKFLFIKPLVGHIGNSTEFIVIENWTSTLQNPDRR